MVRLLRDMIFDGRKGGGEKYVSIEYELWNNYYKPLEEKNKYLQSQVDGKDILVYAHRSWGFGHYTWEYLGVVDLSVNGGMTIKDFNKSAFVKMLQDQTNIRLIRTKEDEEREVKVLNAVEKIESLPKIVRWLFNIRIPKQTPTQP